MKKLLEIIFLFYLISSQNSIQVRCNVTLYPVILIPGDGGNQIHAKLNKTSALHKICELKTTSHYKLLWVNIVEMLPLVLDCLVEDLSLDYDNITRKTHDRPGVAIKIKGFGETNTVENLDTIPHSSTEYFASITNALVAKLNHTRGVTIRGAPYDWRKSPDEHQEYYKKFTSLIEQTFEANKQTKVILIAHSMGNLVVLYWLNNYVSQEWKDKYVRSFVSLSAPWGGAAKTLRLMTCGDNIDIPIIINPLKIRPYQRSATSTAFLMPSDRFWSANEPLVSTPNRNYTVKDYKQLFNDLKFPTGYEYRKNTEKLVYDLVAPEVETHCLYGVGVKTTAQFVFEKQTDFPDKQPLVVYGDGDGTVNLNSLRGSLLWVNQSKPIYFNEINGTSHLEILKNSQAIDYILKLFHETS